MYAQVLLPLRLPFEPTYEVPSDVSVGDYLEVTLSGRRYVGVVSAVDVIPDKPSSVKPVDCLLPQLPSEDAGTVAFWKRMASYYMCSVGEVFKCARPVGRLEDALKDAARKEREKGDAYLKLQIRQSKLYDRLSALDMRAFKKQQQLERAKESTRERYASELLSIRKQMDAVRQEIDSLGRRKDDSVAGTLALELKAFDGSEADAVAASLSERKPLLWKGAPLGVRMVTYADLANRMLARGLSSLILLPETYRTKMMQESLRGYIPEVLLVDGTTSAARMRGVLERIRDGRPYVLVGTRSALLLPHRDLGLAIVDDEHDPSYKQESPAPRYNARDMAVFLLSGSVPVILSSQSPSLETALNVRTGKYGVLPYGGRPNRGLVVDTVAERRKRGMADGIARKLLKELNEAVAAGRQGVVMVPGKGFSPLLKCRDCGELMTCPDCGGYLSVKRNEQRGTLVVWCGHCGKAVPCNGRCPKCGGALEPTGAGLDRVREIVRNFYPRLSIAAIDGDMPEREQDAVLESFAERKVDILVGTQVVQKAFGSDNVGCIGVLEADRWFASDGFRTDERALQLFRRLQDIPAPGGILVLQTKTPERPVFREVDNETFREDDTPADTEEMMLMERRAVGLPPFTRLVDIRIDDQDDFRREAVAGRLRGQLPSGMRLQGPFRKAGKKEENRTHIEAYLPKGKDLAGLKGALMEALDRFLKENRYAGRISVDVDPD